MAYRLFRSFFAISLIAVVVMSGGCEGSVAAPPLSGPGTVRVQFQRSGHSADLSSARIAIGTSIHNLGASGDLAVGSLEPGSYTIRLVQPPIVCTPSGPQQVQVTVSSNDTVTVAFSIYCTMEDNRMPVASPDGTRIAFVSYGGATRRLWTVNSDGTDPKLISNVDATYPAWAPDGGRIAFVCSTTVGGEICTTDTNGTGTEILTTSSFGKSRPSWFPDGRRIAFAGSDGVYIVDRQTSTASQLLFINDVDSPTVSPDGSAIVYAAKVSGLPSSSDPREIFILDLISSQVTRLTQNPTPDLMPSWSRDGQAVFFSRSSPTGTCCLSVAKMSKSGANPTFLTTGSPPQSNTIQDYDPRPLDSSWTLFARVQGAVTRIVKVDSNGTTVSILPFLNP